MGVRPTINYIIGASGVTQKRQGKCNVYEDLVPMHYGNMILGDGTETFDEVLYNATNTSEYTVKGVVGYKLCDRGDEEIARALRVCFPDIFKDDGFREFPIREKRYNETGLLNRGPNAGMWGRDTYEAVRFCQDHRLFYEYYDSFTTWYEFQTAQTVLKLAGWEFEFSRLKRMLVWNWT
jgi:hypothetical protein